LRRRETLSPRRRLSRQISGSPDSSSSMAFRRHYRFPTAARIVFCGARSQAWSAGLARSGLALLLLGMADLRLCRSLRAERARDPDPAKGRSEVSGDLSPKYHSPVLRCF
jgi:hypothetical protein